MPTTVLSIALARPFKGRVTCSRCALTLRGLAGDRTASVMVLAALSLLGVIGFGALAVDVSRALVQRAQNQSVADAAALSAAVAYKLAGDDPAVLLTAAKDAAVINGLAASSITAAQVVNNYPATGDTAVKVTVATMSPFSLAAVLTSGSAFTVATSAYARLPGSAAAVNPCYLALSSGSKAIEASGGAAIATTCDIAAVGSIDFSGGTNVAVTQLVSGSSSVSNGAGSITADKIYYASSWTNPNWNTAVPAASNIVKRSTDLADGLAGDATLAAARALLGTVISAPTLTNPTTTGTTDWDFKSSSPSGPVTAYQTSPGVYVVPAGTYSMKSLKVGGGVKVTFANGANVSVSNGLSNGGTLIFGNGNLDVNGGFSTGSNGVTIGDGNVNIGGPSGSISFNGTSTIGNGTVTMNNTLQLGGGSYLTIGTGSHSFKGVSIGGGSWMKLGAGDFFVNEDVSVSGGSELALGAGEIRIGHAASGGGNCISLSGSAWFIMGNGAFSCDGSISTAGGSKIIFGDATNHYVNGDLTIAGAALFGAGRYTVDGGFKNGTGGTTWPQTSSSTGLSYGSSLNGESGSGYDMVGVNVTFILNGALDLSGGAKTKLIAPSTTTGGAIADMLVESLSTANTKWTGGSGNYFVGMVHVPNSDVTMSGGNSTASGSRCFMLTANTIKITGGATSSSSCPSIPSSGSGSGASSSSITLVN